MNEAAKEVEVQQQEKEMESNVNQELNDILKTTNPEALEAGLLELFRSNTSTSADQERVGGWTDIENCLIYLDLSSTTIPSEVLSKTKEVILNSVVLRNHISTTNETITQTKLAKQATSFKHILQAWFRVLPVIGDGNCLFRAAVRSIFAPLTVPRDREDSLSLLIREELNRTTTEEESEFVIKGINDSKTMSKAGEWADAVQVKKLANFLGIPVYVLRFDDPNVHFDVLQRKVIPSSENRFGETSETLNKRPLMLLFTPSPGHYETIVQKELLEPELELELCAVEAFSSIDEECAEHVGNVLLMLEAFADELTDLWHDCSSTCESDVKKVIEIDLNQRGKQLIQTIARFKNSLLSFGNKTLVTEALKIATSKRAFIKLSILEEIINDELAFDNDNETSLLIGKGPLSSLFLRVSAKGTGGGGSSNITNSTFDSTRPRSNSWNHNNKLPPLTPIQSIPPLPMKKPNTTEEYNFTPTSTENFTTTSNKGIIEELISSDYTSEESWINALKHYGNMLQVRNTKVNGAALNLLKGLAKKAKIQIRFIEVYYCEIDEFACILLSQNDFDPLSEIKLESCKVPAGYKSQIKPSNKLKLNNTQFI